MPIPEPWYDPQANSTSCTGGTAGELFGVGRAGEVPLPGARLRIDGALGERGLNSCRCRRQPQPPFLSAEPKALGFPLLRVVRLDSVK